VSDENTDICGGTAAKKRNTIGGVSAQVDWALGDYTLTSVTARRKVDDEGGRIDLDSIPLPSPSFFQSTDQHYRNLSQEFRLASPDADWGNFVAGLYYFNGDINGSITQEYRDPALFGPFLLGQTSWTSANVKDLAIFGQGTYRLTKDWSLNLGARWGRGRATASRTLALAPGAPAGFSSLAPLTGSVSDSYTSWRVGTQYEFTPSNVGYVSFVQGYKGFAVNENASDPSIPLVVRPEIPRVLEAGMKNVFLDGRFAMNVAAYYSTIKDFQAQIFNPTNSQFVFSNAPEARTHGVSLSFYGRPTTAFTVNGGAAYTIAQYGPGYFTPCGAASAPGCVRSAQHDQVAGAPRFRATLAAEYVIPVGTLKAAFAGDVVYQSKQVFNPTDPMRNFEPRTTLGARVGLRSQDDKWGVSLYVRNLLDDFQPSFRTNNILGFVTGDTRSYFQAVGADARRLFGLTFDAKF
jgi:iron complex outermembrane receptor protein